MSAWNPNAPIVHLSVSEDDYAALCGEVGETALYRDESTCPECRAIAKESRREDPPTPGSGRIPQGLLSGIGGRR